MLFLCCGHVGIILFTFTSATVRNRPQPSATVRNRSQPFATVRAIPVWQVLQKGSLLEVSHVALLRFAWHAWHFVTFKRVGNVSKVVLCGRRNTLVSFSQDELQFSWQAQHFGRVHFISRGRRSLAYFLRIALAGRRQVATRCKWHFMRCDEN